MMALMAAFMLLAPAVVILVGALVAVHHATRHSRITPGRPRGQVPVSNQSVNAYPLVNGVYGAVGGHRVWPSMWTGPVGAWLPAPVPHNDAHVQMLQQRRRPSAASLRVGHHVGQPR